MSFDEIVVTQFTISAGLQTLPVWIFSNLFRPNQAPVVNVVAAVLVPAGLPGHAREPRCCEPHRCSAHYARPRAG
ncbi:MAG: hypothetical protein IPK24_17730 [Kineosporiaceae bacterium]|nr:hypothetical protein [Kineosporiaceae bacterium]